ncbi:hypothetical protein WJU23_14090 [Prosthecobacter sp. SYSU 5D2]|uniref:hypothetical protein n=1 Tax=Prosthecobacter sp. SYSU 5D2 TaxID=3134134 RepID=UPI0031FE9EE8
MFLQTFRILPWQLGSAGLLAFGSALGGGYLMMAPGATKEVWVPASKSLTLALPKDDPAAALKEELNRLTLAQKQAGEKLQQVKLESTQLQKRHEDQQAAMRKQQEDAGAPLPEEELLKTYLAKPPAWQELGLTGADLSLVSNAWSAPASEPSKAEIEAAELLEKRRQQVIQQAEQEKSGLKKTLEERKSMLVSLKNGVEQKEMELVSNLDLSSLKDEEIAALKAAIMGLMQGSLRAVPGKNFTNSVGMEMVWVPFKDSGFWIGRTEVKMTELKQVLPAESNNCTADDEGIVYRILFSEADKFCKVLSQNERSAGAMTSGQLSPEGWAYQLPSSGQWQYARQTSNAQGLGLENLQGGVSELMSDSSNAGYRVIFGSSPGSSEADTRPKQVPDSRTFVKMGNDAKVVGSSITEFTGRVGFRAALLPAPLN